MLKEMDIFRKSEKNWNGGVSYIHSPVGFVTPWCSYPVPNCVDERCLLCWTLGRKCCHQRWDDGSQIWHTAWVHPDPTCGWICDHHWWQDRTGWWHDGDRSCGGCWWEWTQDRWGCWTELRGGCCWTLSWKCEGWGNSFPPSMPIVWHSWGGNGDLLCHFD